MIRCMVVLFCLLATASAEPLMNFLDPQEGALASSNTAVAPADDYLRLKLQKPSYVQIVALKKVIENWAGPKMVIIESDRWFRVQAPRDPTERATFLAALLELNVE